MCVCACVRVRACVVIQGVVKGDMKDVLHDAGNNAKAVTPVGAYVLKKLTA